MSDHEAKQATPAEELERQIISANVPKNEREWWASHEIERLRASLSTLESRLREAERRAEEAEALQANLRNMINAADETIRKLNGRIVAVESAERQLSELRAENERRWQLYEESAHKAQVVSAERDELLSERDTLALQVAGLAWKEVTETEPPHDLLVGVYSPKEFPSLYLCTHPLPSTSDWPRYYRPFVAPEISSTPSDHSGDANGMVPLRAYVEAGRLAVERHKAEANWSEVHAGDWDEHMEAASARLRAAAYALHEACADIIEREKGDAAV